MPFAVDPAVSTDDERAAATKVEQTLLQRADDPVALAWDEVPLQLGQFPQDKGIDAPCTDIDRSP